MIYTVTFNPAIDYVVRLDAPLEVGEVNRAQGEDCVLGGKGINVSGVLAQLGCESVALGFVAGDAVFTCAAEVFSFLAVTPAIAPAVIPPIAIAEKLGALPLGSIKLIGLLMQ